MIEVIQGGRVIRGMDVVRKIRAGKTHDREQLVGPVAILRIYRNQPSRC